VRGTDTLPPAASCDDTRPTTTSTTSTRTSTSTSHLGCLDVVAHPDQALSPSPWPPHITMPRGCLPSPSSAP